MIICFSGPSCAGKTTSSEYIQKEKEVNFLEGSDFVREEYSNSDFDGDIYEFVVHSYETRGKDIFYRIMEDDIDRLAMNSPLVISGFRTVEEIVSLKKTFSDVYCFGIYANSQIRFQRYLEREEDPEFEDYLSFIEFDFLEYGFGVQGILLEECERIILNEGSFSSLYHKISEQVVAEYL